LISLNFLVSDASHKAGCIPDWAHDVPGFPAILNDLLTRLGYRWYPEYTVFEDYDEFNQEQYHAVMSIYDRTNMSIRELCTFHGVGVTVDMAVHDAAYAAIVRLHGEHPRLEETGFRYLLYTTATEESGNPLA
jgi:hypothetical protein